MGFFEELAKVGKSTIAGTVQSGIGIGQTIAGAIKNRKLNKTRPEYEIQSEFQRNIDLAQGIKNRGMDQASMNLANRGIQRSAMLGLNTLSSRRGSVAGVSNIVQGMSDASMSLSARDAAMRQQNMLTGTQMEMSSNMQLAQQKQAKWSWDKQQKWLADKQRADALVGAGMQNIMGGLKTYAMQDYYDKVGNSGSGGIDYTALAKAIAGGK